jgi:tetraacyldisaccharide 4'-kinase
VAGIAQPERFFAAVRAQGFEIAREFAFRDHHWFTPQELATVEQAARDLGAAILTTEKDAARLGNRPGWAVLPVEAILDDSFAPWLAGRLASARRRH